MQVDTSRFGLVEYEEENTIRFPHGLPGFEDLHTYVWLHPDPELPISYLQCVDDGHVSFIVIDPFLVLPSYEFELSESVKKELQLTKPEDVTILVIVTVKGDIREATVNLKAPLVINKKERIGKQVILHDYPYQMKHPLFSVPQAQTSARGE